METHEEDASLPTPAKRAKMLGHLPHPEPPASEGVVAGVEVDLRLGIHAAASGPADQPLRKAASATCVGDGGSGGGLSLDGRGDGVGGGKSLFTFSKSCPQEQSASGWVQSMSDWEQPSAVMPVVAPAARSSHTRYIGATAIPMPMPSPPPPLPPLLAAEAAEAGEAEAVAAKAVADATALRGGGREGAEVTAVEEVERRCGATARPGQRPGAGALSKVATAASMGDEGGGASGAGDTRGVRLGAWATSTAASEVAMAAEAVAESGVAARADTSAHAGVPVRNMHFGNGTAPKRRYHGSGCEG